MNIEEQLPEQIEPNEHDPRIQAALEELRGLIRQRFPAAAFTVAQGEDPNGIYLTAIVDAEDLDEVIDPIISRIVDMQVEEGLPVYVVPEWPLERVRESLRRNPTRSIEARLALLAP